MKYYIFGNVNNSKEIYQSSKKAAFSSDNLDETLEKFREYVSEVRYTNVYMLVDFGNAKPALFETVKLDDDLESSLPFFIICEWHIGEDKDLVVRKDHTFIVRRGFVHEFEDNLAAIREFEFCINSHFECTFKIMYSKYGRINNINIRQDYTRTIAKSVDVIRNRKIKNKRFKIIPPTWNFVPIKPSTLYLYQLNSDDSTETKYEVVATAK